MQLHSAVARARYELGGAAVRQKLDAKDVEGVARMDAARGLARGGHPPEYDLHVPRKSPSLNQAYAAVLLSLIHI